MRKRLVTLIALALCSLSSFAQTTKEIVKNSNQDVSFSAGMYMNTDDESLQYATVYSLDYGIFNFYNIGFRGGFTYLDDLGTDISMVGAPLRFAWRSGIDKRSTQEKLESSAYSFVASEGDINSAIINLLPIRFEASIGITPMFATSKGGTTYGYSSLRGDYAEELSIKNTFALSADIAGRLSVRVWRLNIFFEPKYHYWLTDNFIYKITTEKSVSTPKLSRSYLSLSLGLNFIF